MKVLNLLLITLLTMFSFCGFANKKEDQVRVLIFSKTVGFYHESIPVGIAAIQKLGNENNFLVDTTTDASLFNDESLKKYDAIIFLSTTGDVLDSTQEKAFEYYIRNGGGFVGIHAASDTEYDWAWYGKLVGGYFKSHPEQQEAVLHVVDPINQSTKHLPEEWVRKDEWYNFKQLNKDTRVLLTIDETSYKGGENGDFHPMAWYHEYEGGRAFYTALGHTTESYSDPLFLTHVLGGIQYAVGDRLDLSKN